LSKLLDLGLLVAVPWVSFFTVVLVFLFISHMLPICTLVFARLFALGCVAVIVLGILVRHQLFTAIGTLTFVAVIAAPFVGAYLQNEYLDYYHSISGGIRFTRVHPGSSPTLTSGAGMLQFIPGTITDDYRTIGFVDGGHIYCVAPVLEQLTDGYPQTVNYWAVGVDCCHQRQHFDCGASQDPHVLTTVLAPPQENYQRAVDEAKSVYNISSPKESQLMTFVGSVEQVQSEIWSEAVNVVIIACAVHLGVSLLGGVAVLEMLPNQLGKPPLPF